MSSHFAWVAIGTFQPTRPQGARREAAKVIMEGFVQGYDDVAAEFAAQWYDDLAERGGARLRQAVTMTTYRPESVDSVARYQAKKLVKGGDADFARACGEFAMNDAFRSLNETIIANVERDKDKGARFARVPTGLETCAFCLMLASRGAVYHTRKTAGEFRHFHRRCDCKVVPSFEDDPDAEIVEGFSPAGLRDRIGQIEQVTGLQFASSKDSAALREYLQQLDAAWMTTCVTCSVTRERGARPLKKEEAVAGFLAGNGWYVEFMREVNKTGVKTADARLNGIVWEFKIPEGWSDADGESLQGEHTVRKQFYKALGKGTDKPLLSNAENSASFGEIERVARKVLNTGDYEINEVLVVDPVARKVACIKKRHPDTGGLSPGRNRLRDTVAQSGVWRKGRCACLRST